MAKLLIANKMSFKPIKVNSGRPCKEPKHQYLPS